MSDLKRLIWDLEVSPNIGMFWRSGYKLIIPPDNILVERAIICVAYKWEGEREVRYLKWDRNQNDATLCKKFLKVLDSADTSVGHNLNKYDLRFFLGRCVHHGLTAINRPKTEDTLVIARKRFMLNSNKLDYIAQVLGLGGKTKTEFKLWRDILIDKCPVAMEKMIKYCMRDVRLTEKVYHALAPYHSLKTHVGVAEGRDKWSCPACGSEDIVVNGKTVTQSGTEQKVMNCNDCDRYYNINQKVYRDYREWRYDKTPTKCNKRLLKEAS